MSLIDKVVAAVAPPSEKNRQEARAKARAAAEPNDWLSMALQHHLQIESAFEAVKNASTAETRRTAQRELVLLFTGHSIAEEAVLYPAMAEYGEKGSAGASYTEHAGAKTNFGLLEYIDPMSQDYIDKLEHLRGAVVRHVYEEEGTRFPELKQKLAGRDQERLTQRFREEFERYMGTDAHWAGDRAAPAGHGVTVTSSKPTYS